MTEPKTEAGKRLLDYLNNGMDDEEALAVAVADIEAEAVNAALDKVAAGVAALRPYPFPEPGVTPFVNRLAVEAAIEQASPRPPRRPSPSYKPKTEADHDAAVNAALDKVDAAVLSIPAANQNPSWVKAQARAAIEAVRPKP